MCFSVKHVFFPPLNWLPNIEEFVACCSFWCLSGMMMDLGVNAVGLVVWETVHGHTSGFSFKLAQKWFGLGL